MTAKRLEDLRVWEEASVFASMIYSATKDLNDYTFKDQIRRAAISIMNNISEGYGRQTPKEFVRFLYFSKGSNMEVKSMCFLGETLDLLSPEVAQKMKEHSETIDKMLYGLIKYLKTQS